MKRCRPWLGYWNEPNQRVLIADGVRSVRFRSGRQAYLWTHWMNELAQELWGPELQRLWTIE